MNIEEVMDEMKSALNAINGLRVHAYAADAVAPPQAIIQFPESVDFDKTYGRGMDQFTIPVTVVVGRVNVRTARDNLLKYVAGSGSDSIKQALESAEYETCHTVVAARFVQEIITISGVDYLGGTFTVNVSGPGS